MDDTNKSRAFIIGDFEKGITIVVTNPVMVAHYSIDALKHDPGNALAGADTNDLIAGLVRELIPILRGVNLDALEDTETDILSGGNPNHLTPVQQKAAFVELDFAETIARLVRNKGTVNTVDFCVGLDIDLTDVKATIRSASPSKHIIAYLNQHSTAPEVFPIDGFDLVGLDIPKPWK